MSDESRPNHADGASGAALSGRLFSRRRVVMLGSASMLLPLLPGTANAAMVSAVRVWPAPDYTRVTLEHDNELTFNQFLVTGPDRFVVDIEGIDLNETLRQLVSKIEPDDPYIKAIRVGQNRPHVVRLVIDLKQPIRPQVFSLAPVAQFKHRLIFDLYPVTPVDPLMALVNKPTVPIDATNQAVDPIGDLARTLPDAATPRSNAAPDVEMTARPPLADPPTLVGANRDAAKSGKPVVARLVTIALDPGHGGEDPGATGKRGSHEKDVVLSIARRVKARIDGEPNMRAMMTRDDDYFVPLGVRVQKARRVQADLFVSIHADAFVDNSANGSSVFVLSEHGATSAAANWLADKENNADLIGGVNIESKDKQLARVLLDLSTTAQINDSMKLGRAMLDHLGKINRLHKAEVEQAGFAVLKAPDIPSILIETAFISNAGEEARLNDTKFQDQLADSIVAGIKRYFAKNPPLAKSRIARIGQVDWFG